MKKYFIQYKSFLIFLGVFFLSYIFLTGIYQSYLTQYKHIAMDPFTQMVTKNAGSLLKWFDKKTELITSPNTQNIQLIYHNKEVIRIIEGCNAMSVIILFVSFVMAFSGKLKNTVLFVLVGSILIYLLNIVRIALLNVLLYYFPSQLKLLHEILFPLVIYGFVFFLWIIWMHNFSKYAKKNNV